MQEKEVKIIEINREKIIQKLEDLGAKKIFEGDLISSYFDFPDNSISNKGVLRIRKNDKETILTFKELIRKKEAKIAEEHETKIDNPEVITEILKGLGLKKIKELKKHRISYKIKNIRFEIDKFPDIPIFLEIEAPSIEKINEFVEKLNLPKENIKSWTTMEILKHYGKD